MAGREPRSRCWLPWLVGFVVLTIAGERLELARIAMGPSAGSVLVLLAAGLVAGVAAALLWPRPGTVLLGAALLVLTGWLASHDVARRTIRTSGLTRYMAGCMLAAYCWLGVAGAIWLLGGPGAGRREVRRRAARGLPRVRAVDDHGARAGDPAGGAAPAAALPSGARRAGQCCCTSPWRCGCGSGDALGSRGAWVTGGVLNVVAVLSFLVVAVGSTIRGSRRRS